MNKSVLADSGGHSHDGNRPMGRYKYPIGSTSTTQTITAKTDANGRLKFRYVASQFGGVERINVHLLSDTTKVDTLSLITKVPMLDSLAPGQHYELVGTPNNWSGTNDPCRTVRPRSEHFRNHYGTARLRLAVQQIANAYDSLHSKIRLRVNDMSLVYGGLFDASNNDLPTPHPWTTPHSEHRIGINADIGYQGINAQNQCVDIDTTDIQKIILKKTTKKPLNHRPPGPPAPHFHIYVRED